MLTDFLPDLGGPHYDAGLVDERGRFNRLCKGGGNDAAIAEQKASREQSAKQFAIQMAMMKKQQEAAASIQTPTIAPILPASPPQRTDESTIEASRDAKRSAARRFSFSSARMAGSNRQPMGGNVVLGGGYKAA
jgi:hypothetical protein